MYNKQLAVLHLTQHDIYISGNGANTTTFDLFDSESGQDLTLSPQTFTSSTEAFINDNSNSLGVPGADTDTGRLPAGRPCNCHVRLYQDTLLIAYRNASFLTLLIFLT